MLRSVDLIAQYDSYATIRLISPRPLLMIAGSEAESAYFSREAVEKAAEPKELVVIDGATHIDLYDKDAYVTPAVAEPTDLRQAPGRLTACRARAGAAGRRAGRGAGWNTAAHGDAVPCQRRTETTSALRVYQKSRSEH
ncbi:alpha/beta hydrolase [Streptomyces sp. NPDC059441]|uniref:alpha/beta hydrolase n=1 Tax=Streptomyces sp. NPDC059441 TaxID=3346829 RepID=UPI00367CF8DD